MRADDAEDREQLPPDQLQLLHHIATLSTNVEVNERSIRDPPTGFTADQLAHHIDSKQRVIQNERAALARMTKDALTIAIQKHNIYFAKRVVAVGQCYASAICELLSENMEIVSPEFVSEVILANGINLSAHISSPPSVLTKHVLPLIRAAALGRHDILSMLVSETTGLRVTDHDERGQTPLHAAAAENKAIATAKLLSLGAQPFAMDADQRTPILLSIASGTVDAFRVILDFEADAFDSERDMKNHFGSTAYSKLVTFAAVHSHTFALRELILRGAMPEVQLEFALVKEGKVDSLRVLLDSGLVCPHSSVNAEGKTLIQTAMHAAANRESIVTLLLSKDVRVLQKDVDECPDPVVRQALSRNAVRSA